MTNPRNSLRLISVALLLAAWLSQPACFFKKGNPEEKEYDVYGTVTEVTPIRLVIQTKKGEREFVMTDASIKGGDFQPGALVHVYYRIREGANQVTMVVEKIG